MSEQANGDFIRRRVDPLSLTWPAASLSQPEYWNRLYIDMRGYSWKYAREILEFEEGVLAQNSWNVDAAQESLEDCESLERLCGLDIGVASTVFALSAAKCAPISSCNGAPGHGEYYPIVVFFSRLPRIADLLESASEAGCGLENSDDGTLVVYAETVKGLLDFARELIARRKTLKSLRKTRKRNMRQLKLSLI